MTTDARNGGYVALYRSLLNHPLMNQLPAPWLRIFVAILLSANWKPGVWYDGFQNVAISPGSLATSIEKLSKIAGSSVQQVRSALKYLLATGAITSKTTSKYTLITITNWATYQGARQQDNKLDNEQDNEAATNGQQGHNKVVTTIKEGNKENIEETEEQHHQDARDDAADPSSNGTSPEIPGAERSAFVNAVELVIEGEFRLSRAGVAQCSEYQARSVEVDAVRAGVLLARQRNRKANLNSGVDNPIHSLEYCRGPIEEAIQAGWGAIRIAELQLWLRRHPTSRQPAANSGDEDLRRSA